MASPTFDWMHTETSRATRADFAEKRRNMQRNEIRDRARLLRRLGHDQAAATRRIRENLEWEFDNLPRPWVIGELDKIVAAVFKK